MLNHILPRVILSTILHMYYTTKLSNQRSCKQLNHATDILAINLRGGGELRQCYVADLPSVFPLNFSTREL